MVVIIIGNKKKMNRMKEYGFWLATADEATGHYTEKCLDYVPVPYNKTLSVKV